VSTLKRYRGWKIEAESLGNRLYAATARKGERSLSVSLTMDAVFIPERELESMIRLAIRNAEETD
jgi:hypothetical protein